MRKLAEVEDARALMTEALNWSVMTWLREKKRVRRTADKANEALDALNREVKNSWSDGLKAAYNELVTHSAKSATGKQREADCDPELMAVARRVKHADEEAERARMDAEQTFDEAERQLSTSLARDGCHKAIHSWDLHEKAIRKAESAEK